MAINNTIPPIRLWQAVDAIELALEELGVDRFDGRPTDLMGAPDQPEAFQHFTRFEIGEAERFLIRCGVLPAGNDHQSEAS